MATINCMKLLSEAAVEVNRGDFLVLSEEARLQVTDDVLTGMMKFITDKYNSIDFSEIERSAGDISKFKYTEMIKSNVETLSSIYQSSTDPGAKNYLEVCNAVNTVLRHLSEYRIAYSEQYKAGNGIIQLLYTSLVASCIYSIGVLVSNTIRFVTTEQDTDCQVLYDEIPGTMKHVHIKNVLAAANDIQSLADLVKSYQKDGVRKAMQESVSLAMVSAAAVGVIAVIALIPKILILIREIIYSVYFSRVKVSDMLTVQIDLINTNIESLEHGRGNKKVVARQRKIVQKLEKWKNRVAIKMDTTTTMVNMQKRKENTALRVEQNSPIMMGPDAGALML